MKAYLITTGSVFGLIAVLHVWRAIVEPSARDPWFIVLTVLAAGFCAWAFSLLKKLRATPA
jgi:hypothetical protein